MENPTGKKFPQPNILTKKVLEPKILTKKKIPGGKKFSENILGAEILTKKFQEW